MNINITIYSLFTGITIIAAFYFGLESIVKSISKKSFYSFAILSFLVFFLSLSNMLMLLSENAPLLKVFSFILVFAMYMFPAALFHYTVDLLDYNFFKKDLVKYVFYLISFFIIIFMIVAGKTELEKTAYGYTVNSDISMQFGIFYMAPLMFFIIAYSIYNLIKTSKTNAPLSRIIIFLCGVSIFTLATSALRPLEAVFEFGIPANSFLMFLFYIFLAISNLITELNAEHITFSKMFQTTDDCIMLVNKKGDIEEINDKMYVTLFGCKRKGRLESDKLIENMSKAVTSKDKLGSLFDYLKKDSLENFNTDIECILGGQKIIYNVTVSPIIFGKNKTIGKIAIFRNVSENRLLQERLKEESIRDFLTGAFNRRYFFDLLNNAIRRFERYGTSFCILMIDIDKFKKLNDSYGHLTGDWLLIEIVKVLERSIRKGIDSVIRFGGDEFVVILDESDIGKAEVVSKRIISDFSAIDRKGTTLSIGISQYRKGLNASEFIKEADSLMYEAKMENCDSIKKAYKS